MPDPEAGGATKAPAGVRGERAPAGRKPAPTEQKPTPGELGIDPFAQQWERSGEGDGTIEVAFPENPARWTRGDWVLMRVSGDGASRILVFDRNEWECFLDGVREGEFDDAAR
ncbi:MAG: DUF397 domain-containing protein [Nocardiopsaceae bacterium]|nr:DUF397 domain-containing protein [Nocardiopsaceae bacterium]